MNRTTPRLTRHAQQRCEELGISTKRAKRIVMHRTQTYPGASRHANNGIVCQSASDVEYAVVWDPDTNEILTVLPRVAENYTRTSNGYRTDPVPQ